MSDNEDVRFNVQMPADLRDDAKANAERGELSKEVRELFRRKAYGVGGGENPSEYEQVKAELREVRNRIDEQRHERDKMNAEINSLETRATRLEERLSTLEEERDELGTKVEMLENMLVDGDRMWPVRIKNVAGVDESTAERLFHELKDQNAELPPEAFTEPPVHEPADWRDATEQ